MDDTLNELAALFHRLANRELRDQRGATTKSHADLCAGRAEAFRLAAKWCRLSSAGVRIEVSAAGGPAGEG